ncbi:MAG: LysR family transcriptional regulator [Cellvibrionaceae bacterium]
MLERHHLMIIREVDRLGTLTDAAKSLNLTQPALSHAIKKLEQQLGAVIWRKEGRNLRLTESGRYLLGVSAKLLPQLEYAENVLADLAKGQRGTLRIGMECHPCYQWLLKVVSPYLDKWPDVDLDVLQKFQFGGVGALFNDEIDVLVTPDPFLKKELVFEPVFSYEQVLVVQNKHPLAKKTYLKPSDLSDETLITYPVEAARLDIFNQFLLPANCSPKKHKVIETTDIMLQMVSAGRGVAALPKWLADEYKSKFSVTSVRLGKAGIKKNIYLGVRKSDVEKDYLASFFTMARNTFSSKKMI